MLIRELRRADVPAIVKLWNACVERKEVLYRPLTEAYFEEKFLNFEGAILLAAEEEGKLTGWISGSRIVDFLPGQTEENTPGYLTVIMVDPACRRCGIGSALLGELESRFAGMGKKLSAVSSLNPVNLDWVIPGTPGHEHNNMPGADEGCPGYAFLQKKGYAVRVREVAMYLNLADYQPSEEIEKKRSALKEHGIKAGLYDPAMGCEFDGMCDRVGSEYWRKVLRDETTAENPRPILAAVTDGHIVGFTGPVDRQPNGRGWFTGICTDPLYEKRGIASVLFNDLMGEFIKVGAEYSTLFTGTENHAQRLYLKTGFRPARHFAIMNKSLEGME